MYITPPGALFVGFYLVLIGIMLWSSLRHRREGWISGLILALLLATIPLWVMGGYFAYQALLPK